MKHYKLALMTAVALTFCFIACSQSDADNGTSGKEDKTTIESLIAAENDYQYLSTMATGLPDLRSSQISGLKVFSINSIKEFSKLSEADWVASPVSLLYALGMVAEGAGATSASEILEALSLEDLSVNDIHKMLLKLTSVLSEEHQNVALGLANAAIVREDIKMQEQFRENLKAYYDANAVGLDFTDSKLVLDYINGWANRKTDGMIDKVLNSVSPATLLYLINALYFKADWANQFVADFTVTESFYNSNGVSVAQVDMMNQRAEFNYAETSMFQAVSLPLADGGFDFTIILPKNGYNTSDILSEVDDEAWSSLVDGMETADVNLALPKFDTDNTLDCEDLLKTLGIRSIFSSGALTRIAAEPCSLDFCKQIARLKINEKGLEAAAVTIMGIAGNSGAEEPEPVEFRANHPFLYVLHEKTTGAILFAGKFSGGNAE